MTFLFICVSLILVYRGHAQDFVFPQEEEPAYLSGNNPVITERIPIYIPMRCPENMLLYPGSGDKSSWLCDCKPGYLYFPLNNSCHEAYRRGPCPIGNYVYLPINDAVPRCIENPCVVDGMVPYRGECQTLGTSGTACYHGVLKVNSTNFQIECVPMNDRPLQSIFIVPVAPCPNGTRRIPSGDCKKVFL